LAEDARRWAPTITRQAVRSFLGTLVNPGTPSSLEAGDVTVLAFGVGGWLLSAFLPDGKKWTEFLDEVEDALESVEES
jgi:hypothetical protein